MTEASRSNFAGLRVIAFESRRAVEMTNLVTMHGGQPTVVPSIREIPVHENAEAMAFERALLAGEIDVAIFLTGVGTRMLAQDIETRVPHEQFLAALARIPIVARGPKPAAALRDIGVAVTINVPEPNTWREVLAELDARGDSLPLTGRRVALQEYGMMNRPLMRGLKARGATVIRVPVYRWALPEDTGPLQQAIHDIIAGEYEVALFTAGTQVWHLFKLAGKCGLEQELCGAFERVVVASVGPTTSEALAEFEVAVDFQPEHPKMGHLVKYVAEQSRRLLIQKRARRTRTTGQNRRRA